LKTLNIYSLFCNTFITTSILNATNLTATDVNIDSLTVNDLIINGSTTSINSTTVSTNTSTGCLTCDGGVGIVGRVNIGNQTRLYNTTDTTTIGTGCLLCYGGISVAKNIYIGSNATIVGLTSINNALEIGPNGTNFSYIDLKTTGGNSDYDLRIGCTGGSSSLSGNGELSIQSSNFNLSNSASLKANAIGVITNSTTNFYTFNENGMYFFLISSAGGMGSNSSSINTVDNLSKCYTILVSDIYPAQVGMQIAGNPNNLYFNISNGTTAKAISFTSLNTAYTYTYYYHKIF
jgi:hypothetical protein